MNIGHKTDRGIGTALDLGVDSKGVIPRANEAFCLPRIIATLADSAFGLNLWKQRLYQISNRHKNQLSAFAAPPAVLIANPKLESLPTYLESATCNFLIANRWLFLALIVRRLQPAPAVKGVPEF
jgi:hypothetical protein